MTSDTHSRNLSGVILNKLSANAFFRIIYIFGSNICARKRNFGNLQTCDPGLGDNCLVCRRLSKLKGFWSAYCLSTTIYVTPQKVVIMTINLSYILCTTFLQSLHYKRRVCEMLSVGTVLSPTIVQCFFDSEFSISISRNHLYRGTPFGPQTPRYIGILLY